MQPLGQVPAFAAGLVLSIFAFACIEVTSHVSLLDGMSRQALKHLSRSVSLPALDQGRSVLGWAATCSMTVDFGRHTHCCRRLGHIADLRFGENVVPDQVMTDGTTLFMRHLAPFSWARTGMARRERSQRPT